MNKRQHTEYSHRNELRHAGVDLHKRDAVAYNHGSETFAHELAKLAAARVLRNQGYRIDTEVSVPEGEIDIVAYASEDKDAIAVEVETCPTEEIKAEKVAKYVYGLPIRDCLFVNVSEMPMHGLDAVEYVAEELGYEP